MRKPLRECSVGDELEDKNGNRWKVQSFTPDRLKVQIVGVNQEAFHLMDADREVEVIEEAIPGVDPLDMAEYRTTVALGAEKVAAVVRGRKNETKHYAPATFDHVGSMLAHLAVMHGMDVSSAPQTMAELRKIHGIDHTEKKSAHYIHHIHNDAKFQGKADIDG